MANFDDVLAAIQAQTIGKIATCPAIPIDIPGIAAADAFDAGDCMGTIFQITVPKQGILYSATFFDLDDEGGQVDLEIFKAPFTQIASDAAWAPSDGDLFSFVTELAFVVFDDHINNQTAQLTNIGVAYTAPLGKLYIQAVCRGTPTIAAGSSPRVQIQIISYDPDWKS